MFSRRALGFLASLAILFALLIPTVALAAGGSAADSQYKDPLAGAKPPSRPKTAAEPSKTEPKHRAPKPIVNQSKASGSSSDTGLDVELIALACLLVAGGGFALRWRLAR